MTRLLGHYVSLEIVLLGVVELALAFVVIYAMLAAPGMYDTYAAPALAPGAADLSAMLAFTVAATAATIGLYRPEICLERRRLLLNVMVAGGLAFPAALLVSFILHVGISQRSVTWLAEALLLWLACILVTRRLFSSAVRRNWFVRRVLVVGDGPHAARLTGLLNASRGIPFEPVPAASMPLSAPALRENGIWGVVVATEDDDRSQADDLLDCKLRGIRILQDSSFCELHLGRVDLDAIDADWLLYSGGFRQGRLSQILKRATDLVVSVALLVATLPLIGLTALLVRLETPGPVFYRQQRVGLYGKPFTLFKFRSMRLDAEAAGSPRWAQRQDPRITRVGAFIRPMRIDELPQLINVLRGEMSMIGPRPERPHFVEQLGRVIPFYHQRSYVKPGLTGWAQVNFPYGASVEDAREKLSYDLYYVKNRNMLLDLMILVATIRVILFREGAR